MFDKLFGKSKKKTDLPEPAIQFGRYSDNNKTMAKVNRWTDADNLFKEKKYPESLDAFFDYLRDESVGNVIYNRTNGEGQFELFQGSKIVRGRFTTDQLSAEVTLARMPQPSVPVMRRLLELNFSLYYCRYALDGDRLCMRFDTPVVAGNPNKLYYGLKELATKADKQDDLLVQDFTTLEKHDIEHIHDITDAEKEVKYQFMQKWITETLDIVGGLDADKFHGGIAYMLLTLAFQIDYLLVPEGKLMHDLEKIVETYFRKDEKPVPEKNRDLVDSFRKLLAKTREEVFHDLYRSRHTFSIVAPQAYKTIADMISASNQNMIWYKENSYPQIATKICEYGFSYCQYSYSLPKPVSALFELFMRVNYSDYFEALGFPRKYYNKQDGRFDVDAIFARVQEITESWKAKFPALAFRTENLRFDNLTEFNHSFTNEIEFLNLENK